MSFGPGNAFNSFASSVSRPPRRATSSSSFKDSSQSDTKTSSSATATAPDATVTSNWPISHDRENSSRSSASSSGPWSTTATTTNGTHQDNHQRSFSSILSNTTNTVVAHSTANDSTTAAAKPFVYSREFILSLYDEHKALKRPIDLADHHIATRDSPTKPWALQDYREGEKELFASSIHPASTRARNPGPQSAQRANGIDNAALSGNGAGGAGATGPTATAGTLDLSTLGILPRDRDRALGAAGTPARAGLSSPSTEKDLGGLLGSARRARPGLTSSGSNGSMGILGGVLGGLGGGTSATKPGSKKLGGQEAGEDPVSSTKEVWQGGRWRRQNTAEAEGDEKRPSAFGPRRYPTNDTPFDTDADSGDVPNSWDEPEQRGQDSDQVESNGHQLQVNGHGHDGDPIAVDSVRSEPDLDQHASSILGSLALDSDPVDDPLEERHLSSGRHSPIAARHGTVAPSPAATTGPPPGLAPVNPLEALWQYRDPQGQIQGPFSAQMMHDWYTQSFFQLDLRVKRAHESEFETLDSLCRRSRDNQTPFLTAPPQALHGAALSGLPPPARQASSGWPTASPLEQFTATAAHGHGQHTSQPQSRSVSQTHSNASALDPWGAPLPAASISPALHSWNSGAVGGGLFGATTTGGFQQQSQQQQQQAGYSSPVLLRQYTQSEQQQQPFLQQQQQQHSSHQQLASPFFDPSQLVNHAPGAGAWHAQQPQQYSNGTAALQQQQPSSLQQPWASLINGAGAAAAVSPIGTPIGTPTIAPIGSAPGSVLPSKANSPEQRSPWASVEQQDQPRGGDADADAEAKSAAAAKKAADEQAAADAAQEQEKKERAAAAAAKEEKQRANAAEQARRIEEAERNAREEMDKQAREEAEAARRQAEDVPQAQTQAQIPVAAKSTPTKAPWVKDSDAASPGAGGGGPSLREIQQAEAREAEKRKAAQRLLAAQRAAAAAEAELPSSASWGAAPTAASPAGAGTAAPWLKNKTGAGANGVAGGASGGQKSLKEIQEEEENRKKAALAQAQNAATAAGASVVGGAARGYAGSAAKIPAATFTGGGSWTTVAVKPPPAAVATPSTVRSVVPGLPVSSVTPLRANKPVSSIAASSSNMPSLSASRSIPPPSATQPASAHSAPRSALVSTPVASVVRAKATNASATPAVVYDAENPPPPSAEFVKWIRESLKGLTVPMDEFIQMLLSFPLDASADVLEIVSDSVYANSSTLDGRRFANEFSQRRKIDVAARYPNLLINGKPAKVAWSSSSSSAAAGGSGPTRSTSALHAGSFSSSMANALKSQPVAQTPEWSVKVAGSKKKNNNANNKTK